MNAGVVAGVFCAHTYATSALSQTVHREMSSKLVLLLEACAEDGLTVVGTEDRFEDFVGL